MRGSATKKNSNKASIMQSRDNRFLRLKIEDVDKQMTLKLPPKDRSLCEDSFI